MLESTAPKPFVFVLMPFDDSFSDIYSLGIKAAADEAGGYCERLDEQIFEERMLDRIYNQINKADVIIADLTGKNPNVFYEVGYAHALQKKVILLTKKAEDIPFDLRHHYHIVYEGKITSLKEELTRRLKWYFDNPTKTNASGIEQLEIFSNNQKIIPNIHLDVPIDPYRGFRLILDLHNVSDTLFDNALKIGLEVEGAYEFSGDVNISLHKHENKSIFIRNNYLTPILPDCWESIYLPLHYGGDWGKISNNELESKLIFYSDYKAYYLPFYLKFNR